MPDPCGRHHDVAQAARLHPKAPVGVLPIQEELLVQRPDPLDRCSLHQEATPGHAWRTRGLVPGATPRWRGLRRPPPPPGTPPPPPPLGGGGEPFSTTMTSWLS